MELWFGHSTLLPQFCSNVFQLIYNNCDTYAFYICKYNMQRLYPGNWHIYHLTHYHFFVLGTVKISCWLYSVKLNLAAHACYFGMWGRKQEEFGLPWAMRPHLPILQKMKSEQNHRLSYLSALVIWYTVKPWKSSSLSSCNPVLDDGFSAYPTSPYPSQALSHCSELPWNWLWHLHIRT